jgi:hypothetical protein
VSERRVAPLGGDIHDLDTGPKSGYHHAKRHGPTRHLEQRSARIVGGGQVENRAPDHLPSS